MRHTDYSVHGCADLVAHVCQEIAFCPGSGLCSLLCMFQIQGLLAQRISLSVFRRNIPKEPDPSKVAPVLSGHRPCTAVDHPAVFKEQNILGDLLRMIHQVDHAVYEIVRIGDHLPCLFE